MEAKQFQSFTSLAAYSAYVTSVVIISGQVKENVPNPYMDEIFHIAQAKKYCNGQWSEWDPKITTPPGLYIVPALIRYVVPNWFNCSTDSLRWTNGFLLSSLPLLVARILSHFRTTPYPPKPGVRSKVRFLVPEDDIILEAIIISCFPIVYFSGFLFYTDLGSLLSILACYDQSLAGRHVLAGFIGLWSCFFRQTNVIWVAFIAGSALIDRLKHIQMVFHQHSLKPPPVDDPRRPQGDLWSYNLCLMDASLRDLPRAFCSLVLATYQHPLETLPVISPYFFVLTCFLVFVHYNDGIVLGDRLNHTTAFHLPQLYYFVSFSVPFLAPVWLGPTCIARSIKGLFGSYKSFAKSLILCTLMMWTVHRYTYEHPFLLSDNRHYTFYVWRRVFKSHELVRYLLVPGYLICIKLILERLARSYTTNLLTTTFYLTALCLTLIPARLIEPRYFVIPYIMIRLHVRPVIEEAGTWSIRLIVETCFYGLVNLVTLFVFLYRPFKSQPGEWEDGVWQRFMW